MSFIKLHKSSSFRILFRFTHFCRSIFSFFKYSFQATLCIWSTIFDAFVITFIPYFIMIIYNIKIVNYLKHHEHSLSAISRRVQTDLNRVLTAQAIIPVFFSFFPVGLHIFSVTVDVNLVFETFIGGILYCWIPVGNAICVLFFVTAYRLRLKRLIFRVKPRIPNFLSVSGMVTTVS